MSDETPLGWHGETGVMDDGSERPDRGAVLTMLELLARGAVARGHDGAWILSEINNCGYHLVWWKRLRDMNARAAAPIIDGPVVEAVKEKALEKAKECARARRTEMLLTERAVEVEAEMVVSDYLAALDEFREGPAPEGWGEWRPIESAPKDGKRVLLAWGGKVEQAFYLDNSNSPTPWKGWRVESGRLTPSGKPTHWRPLPTPPDSEGG